MTAARRILAGLLLAFVLAIATISNLTDDLRVCEDVVARVGTAATVQSCRPLSLTDAPVPLAVLMVLGLLAPDLGKIKIAGLVELERKADAQERRADALEHKIDLVSARAHATAAANVLIGATLPRNIEIVVDKQEQAEKAREFAEGLGQSDDER